MTSIYFISPEFKRPWTPRRWRNFITANQILSYMKVNVKAKRKAVKIYSRVKTAKDTEPKIANYSKGTLCPKRLKMHWAENETVGNWTSKSDQELSSSICRKHKNFHNDFYNIMRKKRCGFYKARCREKIYHVSLLRKCWLLHIFLRWKRINQQLKLQQSNISQKNM